MAENQIEQFILRSRRRGQLFDKEGDLELRIGGIDRLYGDRWSRRFDDQPAVQNGATEKLGAGRRCRLSVELDGDRHAVNAGRRADIDDFRLGNGAVRNDRQVSPSGQDVCRTPVYFDNAAVRAAVETDPVTRPIRPAEAQHNAREDIPQGALECQAEDDRDHAGSREQALDRKIEDISDDGKEGGEINQAGEQVLQQLALARPVFDDHKSAEKADQKPSRPQPPRDFQCGMHRIEKRRARQPHRLVGDDIGIQQNYCQQDQERDPQDRSHERILFQQEMRREHTQQHQTKRNDQRVACGGLDCSGQIAHADPSRLAPQTYTNNPKGETDAGPHPRHQSELDRRRSPAPSTMRWRRCAFPAGPRSPA